ncbi:unnamed protein product [Linum trigynum]|uniref:Uncharacterized protein n=1 Tax=Linum trigynum TaxID=586398 RepID=A0AAV2FRL2_9ROSI
MLKVKASSSIKHLQHQDHIQYIHKVSNRKVPLNPTSTAIPDSSVSSSIVSYAQSGVEYLTPNQMHMQSSKGKDSGWANVFFFGLGSSGTVRRPCSSFSSAPRALPTLAPVRWTQKVAKGEGFHWM